MQSSETGVNNSGFPSFDWLKKFIAMAIAFTFLITLCSCADDTMYAHYKKEITPEDREILDIVSRHPSSSKLLIRDILYKENSLSDAELPVGLENISVLKIRKENIWNAFIGHNMKTNCYYKVSLLAECSECSGYYFTWIVDVSNCNPSSSALARTTVDGFVTGLKWYQDPSELFDLSD